MDDHEVAAERGGGSRVALRRSVRIETQRRLRPCAEDRADKLGVGALRVVALKKREVEAFVLVPAGHQRNVALLAGGEDLGRRARQKPSIDDRPKAEPRRGGEDRVGWSGAQLGQGTRSSLAHEIEARGLGLVERRPRASGRREHRPALADRAREQSPGEGRGHQRAHRMGAGGFAGDRDLVRIAAERGDVAFDPFERGDKVEKPVSAGANDARIRR